MTWAKLDDQFPSHPKIARVGGDAGWLFVCGLCYCANHNTGGKLPKAMVGRLSDRKNPDRLASRLVEEGLWEDDGGSDFIVHDYLVYNPTAEEVEARKAKRAAAGAVGGRRSGQTRRSKAEAKSKQVLQQTGSKRASETEAKSNPVPVPLTGFSNENPLPDAALPAGPDHAEAARELVKAFWESCTPRPAVKFIALCTIVERFLIAGHEADAVAAALRTTRAFTVDSIEFALRSGKPKASGDRVLMVRERLGLRSAG